MYEQPDLVAGRFDNVTPSRVQSAVINGAFKLSIATLVRRGSLGLGHPPMASRYCCIILHCSLCQTWKMSVSHEISYRFSLAIIDLRMMDGGVSFNLLRIL